MNNKNLGFLMTLGAFLIMPKLAADRNFFLCKVSWPDIKKTFVIQEAGGVDPETKKQLYTQKEITVTLPGESATGRRHKRHNCPSVWTSQDQCEDDPWGCGHKNRPTSAFLAWGKKTFMHRVNTLVNGQIKKEDQFIEKGEKINARGAVRDSFAKLAKPVPEGGKLTFQCVTPGCDSVPGQQANQYPPIAKSDRETD